MESKNIVDYYLYLLFIYNRISLGINSYVFLSTYLPYPLDIFISLPLYSPPPPPPPPPHRGGAGAPPLYILYSSPPPSPTPSRGAPPTRGGVLPPIYIIFLPLFSLQGEIVSIYSSPLENYKDIIYILLYIINILTFPPVGIQQY